MNDIQKTLVELRPGRSTRINGRWVGATYTGWNIQMGNGPLYDSCVFFTNLPEAAAELAGGKLTDVAS